jgi:long-chain acyl-CoA synthetase
MDSIVANLIEQARARPKAPALVGRGKALTYGALVRGVEAAAAWLSESGVQPGEVVALPLAATPEGVWRGLRLFYGLAWHGAVILPLTADMPESDHAPLMRRFGAVRRLDPAGFDPKRAAARAPARGDATDQPFIYQFSSGTTGTPKAMLFTHGQFAAYARAGAEADRWNERDRALPSNAWPSKVGLRYLLRLHAVGGALAIAAFPKSVRALAALVAAGITGVCGGSAQIRQMLEGGLPPGESLAGLRALRVSSAPSRPEELRRWREQITPNVYYAYGTTETGTIGMLYPEDPLDDKLSMRIAVSGLEARVVDDEDQPVARGKVGHLGYRAAWVPRGYADNPEASARQFRNGWFYPNDLGSIDAAGRIMLLGRSDDVVNFGGVLIQPQSVEGALARHPAVKEAALIGVPDPVMHQNPVAVVVLHKRGIATDVLRRYCEEQVGLLRAPRFFMFVSELPRNANGKVQRDQLVARFLALRS